MSSGKLLLGQRHAHAQATVAGQTPQARQRRHDGSCILWCGVRQDVRRDRRIQPPNGQLRLRDHGCAWYDTIAFYRCCHWCRGRDRFRSCFQTWDAVVVLRWHPRGGLPRFLWLPWLLWARRALGAIVNGLTAAIVYRTAIATVEGLGTVQKRLTRVQRPWWVVCVPERLTTCIQAGLACRIAHRFTIIHKIPHRLTTIQQRLSQGRTSGCGSRFGAPSRKKPW